MMKDRFAKLLLGEDMSGGGKGVSSALALSNAITNLAGNLLFILFKFLLSQVSMRVLVSKSCVGGMMICSVYIRRTNKATTDAAR